MGIEPTIFALGTRCSTTELHPHQDRHRGGPRFSEPRADSACVGSTERGCNVCNRRFRRDLTHA